MEGIGRSPRAAFNIQHRGEKLRRVYDAARETGAELLAGSRAGRERRRFHAWLVGLLEQRVESAPRIARITRRCRHLLSHRTRIVHRSCGITSDSYPRRKKSALIQLILPDNAGRNRLQALEPRRGLEMRALLATM